MLPALLLLLHLPLRAAEPWPVRGPEGVPNGRTIDPSAVFQPARWPTPTPLRTDPAALGQVAADTAAWMRAHPSDPAVQPGLPGALGVSLDRVLRTLDLVASLAATDPNALLDPTQLAARFELFAWTPHQADAGAPSKHPDLRLTRYLVYEEPGCPTRTATCTHALYAAPADDGQSPAPHLRYSRPQVIGGVYEPGGAAAGRATPLVWLSEQGVYRALMQGTVSVRLPDGSSALFNVHRHNGIPYDREQRDSSKQARYWYFQPVDHLLGYGPEGLDRVPLQPGVSVAGDVYNLGLGKLVLLHVPGGPRLAVLSDTGGAFQPNLHQLDLLTGIYPSHEAYLAANTHLPDRVPASLVLAREANATDAR